MDIDSYKYTFESSNREFWLRDVASIYEIANVSEWNSPPVLLDISERINVNSLKPFHLVTLANVIQHLKESGSTVSMTTKNEDVFEYIYNDLGFNQYWSGGQNHVDTRNSNDVFNLWRIVESEKDIYAKHVEEYFRNHFFQNRDLSAISVSLVEAYYNVFDHAKAKGNAFSLIQYDEDISLLYVAISDFGRGISTTVREFDPNINADADAILKALTDNFTIRSTKRNRGFGLGNILAPTVEARIFSRNGLVYKNKEGEFHGYKTDFSFPGTLIYYEIDLSKTEYEDYLTEFMF